MKYKLNKSGWGLTEMLVLSSILLFFFIIAIVLIHQFYNNLKKDTTNSNVVDSYVYKNTESALEDAANEYLSNKYYNMNNLNSITISMKKLADMGYFVEAVYEDCNGYVISSIINGKNISDAYISCKNYKTSGFESWRINE